MASHTAIKRILTQRKLDVTRVDTVTPYFDRPDVFAVEFRVRNPGQRRGYPACARVTIEQIEAENVRYRHEQSQFVIIQEVNGGYLATSQGSDTVHHLQVDVRGLVTDCSCDDWLYSKGKRMCKHSIALENWLSLE